MVRIFLIGAIVLLNVTFGQMIVGIAGGTGCGKTTLAKKIQEAFPGSSCLISQDAYYKDLSFLSLEEREGVNFDHPDSLDFDLLIQHIKDLKQGKSIEKPVYNFHSHSRESFTETVASSRLIILEGILIFSVPEICDQCDLKIFVDTDDDIRLLRRIERDLQERSRTFKSIKEQYLTTVKPMHDAFVQPSKKHADLIVPHGGENPMALSVILSKLNAALK